MSLGKSIIRLLSRDRMGHPQLIETDLFNVETENCSSNTFASKPQTARSYKNRKMVGKVNGNEKLHL